MSEEELQKRRDAFDEVKRVAAKQRQEAGLKVSAAE